MSPSPCITIYNLFFAFSSYILLFKDHMKVVVATAGHSIVVVIKREKKLRKKAKLFVASTGEEAVVLAVAFVVAVVQSGEVKPEQRAYISRRGFGVA